MHPVFVLVRIPNGNVNDVIGLFTHREVFPPRGGPASYRRRASETPSTPCVSRLQSSFSASAGNPCRGHSRVGRRANMSTDGNPPWPTAGNTETSGRQNRTTLCWGDYKVRVQGASPGRLLISTRCGGIYSIVHVSGMPMSLQPNHDDPSVVSSP